MKKPAGKTKFGKKKEEKKKPDPKPKIRVKRLKKKKPKTKTKTKNQKPVKVKTGSEKEEYQEVSKKDVPEKMKIFKRIDKQVLFFTYVLFTLLNVLLRLEVVEK